MVKVITYGTYDLLHFGHVNLLKRAKELGDYLIVGITSDNFDKQRGKINVQQSLIERIEAVKALGIADKIIVEEYEGQKIDDIQKYDVDIFTVGSDWVGTFDYLNQYCKVVYLPRTEGVSSTEIRHNNNKIRLGFVGEASFIHKYVDECKYVNYFEPQLIYTEYPDSFDEKLKDKIFDGTYDEYLNTVDAIYVATKSSNKKQLLEKAIENHKHILCESPIAFSKADCEELFEKAKQNNCILMDAIKTAYSTAYYRLFLMLKSGRIGKIVSIDATCTSLASLENIDESKWNSFYDWAPTALLPVFQLLGTDYNWKNIISSFIDDKKKFDIFSNVNLVYDNAVANVRVGKGVKSEGALIISGTNGYIYVKSPWWKTEYFEIRYENELDTKKFFYKLDGEGIRQELSIFAQSIVFEKSLSHISKDVSIAICKTMEDFEKRVDLTEIKI